ncbi:glutamine synthetase family protein [Nakamurella sp. GG22]
MDSGAAKDGSDLATHGGNADGVMHICCASDSQTPHGNDGPVPVTTADALARYGVKAVLATLINPAGIALSKTIPVGMIEAVKRSGIRASTVWNGFCVDACVATSEQVGPVGELRLDLDWDAAHILGGGLAWAPISIELEPGDPSPACGRGLLGTVQRELAKAGLEARIGHELEFVLVGPKGEALCDGASWIPFGATGLLDQEGFLLELLDNARYAGVEFQQIHSEYTHSQYEVSLEPRDPVAAADGLVLARLIIGRVARRYGLRASFSPMPFLGSAGNGAHQHVSITRGGIPLFSGGQGPHGISDEGQSAIAGVLRSLRDIQGLLTGSILSGERLRPGMCSGLYVGWGLQNREMALRFIEEEVNCANRANLEVKTIDPSANVYIASAAILSAALWGVLSGAPLPAEMLGDPNQLSANDLRDAGVDTLPNSIPLIIEKLSSSSLARALVGDEIVDLVVAVRRHEQTHHAKADYAEIAAKFSLSWSM